MAMPRTKLRWPHARRRRHSGSNCLGLDSNVLGLERYRSSGGQFKNSDHEHTYEERDESRVAIKLVARQRAAWWRWRRRWRNRRDDWRRSRQCRRRTVAVALRNVERRNEPKRMVSGSDDGRSDRSTSGNGRQRSQYRGRFPARSQGQRRSGRFLGIFQERGRNVFARLHRRNTDEITAASKNGLAAEGHDILAFFHEDRARGPLDFVALAKSGERDDVFRQRVHRGVAVGAIAIEVMEGGIFADTLEELINGVKAAPEQ